MIIPSLIRALLEENSVTVTGLGMFYVKKLSAQVKDEVVYPPQNVIEFEYSTEVEGFDFVSKLSQWEQIRIDDAQAEVSQWFDLLEKGLEHSQSVFFDDFGTFSKDLSGKIVFQSVINSQLNIENEGFDPILMTSKINEKHHLNMDKPIIDKRVILKKKKKKRDRLWFALTVFIALATLGAVFLKDTIFHYYQTIFIKNDVGLTIENTEKKTVACISNLIEEDFIIIDDSVADEISNEVVSTENKNETQVTPQKSSESNNLYVSYQKGKYYVIAGSFTNEKDALRHIKEKKLEKYHAKLIVHPDSPRVRVCIGVFENETAAKSFAAQIDKNYWVLK